MKLGDSAEVIRAFSAHEVAAWRSLSGAGGSGANLPEPLIGALFSYLLGVRLPGLGTNYLKQETEYQAPAPIGEPLTARVEIVRLRPEKHLVDLATTCRRADGQLLASGRALVYVADVSAEVRT